GGTDGVEELALVTTTTATAATTIAMRRTGGTVADVVAIVATAGAVGTAVVAAPSVAAAPTAAAGAVTALAATARVATGLALVTAVLAPLGNLLEPLAVVKLLLSGGKHKRSVAIDTLDVAVLELHGSPRSTTLAEPASAGRGGSGNRGWEGGDAV